MSGAPSAPTRNLHDVPRSFKDPAFLLAPGATEGFAQPDLDAESSGFFLQPFKKACGIRGKKEIVVSFDYRRAQARPIDSHSGDFPNQVLRGGPLVLGFLDQDTGGVNVVPGLRLLLQHQDLEAAPGHFPRAGQPRKAGSYHYNVVIHPRIRQS